MTSRDLTTGAVRVWRDSLVRETDGQVTHVFWSDFEAAFGHEYRVTVERSDGAATQATVRVPPWVGFQAQEPVASPRFQADTPIWLDRAPKLHHVTLRVQVLAGPPPGSDQPLTFSVAFVVPRTTERSLGEGRVVHLRWFTWYDRIQTFIAQAARYTPPWLILEEANLSLLIANPEWNPPEDIFDSDVLAEPGLLENVENGFGFVGAGYRRDTTFVPPDSVLEAARFLLEPPS